MIFRGIDVFDLNYEFSSDEFGILHTTEENLPVKGVLVRILSLIRGVFLILITKRLKSEKIPREAILFFASNDNEKKAFVKLNQLDKGSYIIGYENYANGFPLLKIYGLSLLFVPVILYHFVITRNRTKKLSFLYAFDSYCLSFAAIVLLPIYFNRLKPRKIFISNHTRPFQRLIMKLFKNQGLGYIQHASFIDNMPSLNGFNYLLVDGSDSLVKLINSKSSGNCIYTIGSSQHDVFLNYSQCKQELQSVGVCVNNLDNLEDIKDILLFIKKKCPLLKVSLRPHPSDPRFVEMSNFSLLHDLNFSNSRKVESVEFLKGIDILVAGDSNIHLESILLNIPSIYLDLKDNKKDLYGFLKYKMLHIANSPAQIIDILNTVNFKNLNSRELAKPFNSPINTLYQGKSTSLALKIINDDKRFIEDTFIRKIDINKNYIYVLKEQL